MDGVTPHSSSDYTECVLRSTSFLHNIDADWFLFSRDSHNLGASGFIPTQLLHVNSVLFVLNPCKASKVVSLRVILNAFETIQHYHSTSVN